MAHLVTNLGWVDLNFDYSTVCLILPGLMGVWQKRLGSWARWWNSQIQVNRTQVRDQMGHPVHIFRSHARDDEKPHQCSICGRGFLSPHSLREHIMVVHEKLRPFKCRYECGMTMSCIGNRNKHEKNRHGAIFGKA